MQTKGLPQKILLKELETKLKEDFTFNSGRIIGSMCTCPHPLARKVYTRFLDKNLGDSGLFPAVVKLEIETIDRSINWAVSLFPHHIRIVLMPHVQERHVNMFLEDLSKVVDKLGG